MSESAKLFWRSYLSSAGQFFLFAVILALSVSYLPWPSGWWSVFVAEGVVPFVSALACCFVINRKKIRFCLGKTGSRPAVCRFAGRITAVLCLLLFGLAMEAIAPHKYTPILSIFFHFLAYLIFAIFPAAYAVFEFLFVPTETPKTQGQA